MSSLKHNERMIFKKLFDNGAYLLDFTTLDFLSFFQDFDITIDDDRYNSYGNAKMKRLWAFCALEPNCLVGNVLNELLTHACKMGDVNQDDKKSALSIINRLTKNGLNNVEEKLAEEKFLKQDVAITDINTLKLEPSLKQVIEQRINEIQELLNINAPLSVIFLCGSVLEGLLLDAADKDPKEFNTASSSPKNSEGKVKELKEWTLNSLINVEYELDLLSLDVKKHAHSLKDFRNYIHPRQQVSENFRPDSHTAKISWQVLQAAMAGLSGQRK